MIRIEERRDLQSYGPDFAVDGGAIVVKGLSPYRHRLGGDSWRVLDPSPIDGGPTLVLTLDLADPILANLAGPRLDELPICTYATRDVWVGPQVYRIDPAMRQVHLVERGDPATEAILDELAGPWDEVPVALRPMSDEDRPETEDAHMDLTDRFLGGDGAFRVLGPPLWLDAVTHVDCGCGKQMGYVCGIGYEGHQDPDTLIPGRPIMLGEAALYWFHCPDCSLMAVISQPS